ncbi:MAG: SGNH/GDSL hydrolase family protein [Luteolibacter sp.]
MKLIQKSKALYSAAWLHLALCSAASAGLTAYDGFDYGATTGDLTGKNGGSGWSGAYTHSGNSTIYETTGLTYTGLPTTGGASKTADGVLPAATTINFRSFNTIYGDGETETWISFLAQRNGAASTATFAGISFYNSNGIASTDSEVTFANGGTLGAWRIIDNGPPLLNGSTAVTPASDTTYLLVARILWGAGAGGKDAVSLFVNPTLGTLPDVADASLDVEITNFDKVRIAAANAINYTFDEIRVGDSYADVTVPLVTTFFPLEITRTGANYDFSWPSQSGKVYDLLSSTDLSTAPATWAVYDPDGAGGNDTYGDILATAPTNLLSAIPGSGPARFFVVREKAAVPAFSITVENSGVSGNNTTNGLARLATVLATNPDHLVLYFGINDALNATQNKLVSLTSFEANLTSMVNQAVAANVRKVYLVGIHPVNAAYVALRHPTHPQLARLQDHLTEYNAKVANVAAATGATFIDWRARFLEESPGTTIADATADNAASLLRVVANTDPDDDDGVHLTVAGNSFLGVRVAQALSSQVVNGDRITCMGDSITFGFAMTGGGTVTGNTYPAVLKATLNP